MKSPTMFTGYKIVILVVLALPGTAFAYLDPGTGSILIQGLIAAIAAVGVTLRLYWHRFIAFFKRSKKSAPSAGDEETK
jgi:uncharacterized membrane protein